MKNQITKIILISFIALCFFSTAHAALNIDAQVDVPQNCSVTDIDGAIHNYGGAPNSYFAVCALDKAVKDGSVAGVKLSNQFPDFGLFITSINSTDADPNSQYWAIYQNENLAQLGVTSLTITTGDTIKFVLNDFSNNSSGNVVALHIHSLIPQAAQNGGGPLLTGITTADTIDSAAPAPTANTAPTLPAKPMFEIKKAFDFLIAQQKSDGSFGAELYTDWTAMAFATGNHLEQTIKLIKHFEGTKAESGIVTDYERHAMALMALGLDPYQTNGENYIGKIMGAWDGKQFGDTNEDNDDIFALIVLQNAGYGNTDKIISDDISFILSRQKEDGSWDESTDMTGAGIEALSAFSPTASVGESLKKAESFLKQGQKNDGGWGNASSTAWALQGILALGEKPENWQIFTNGEAQGKSPTDYLTASQDMDGGIKDESMDNKIWETAYAISALSGKTWNQVMQKFEKPKNQTKYLATKNVALKTQKQISIQNSASVINAVTSPATNDTKPQKKGWFSRFWSSIFGN